MFVVAAFFEDLKMLPTRDKELETASEEIARLTAEFLKKGGKVKTFDNSRTEYSKSGMHAYNNKTRREAAKARRQ